MEIPRIVFIDTQVYESKGYRFSSVPLASIAALGQQGRIQLVTTSVVAGELDRHLREKAYEAHRTLRSLLGNRQYLPENSCFDSLAAIQIEEARDAAVERWRQFRADSGTERIGARYADVRWLLRGYFKELPPFSSKKKHEFPDAISLLSLKGRFPSDDIAVITRDRGIAEWCSNERGFFHYEDIESYLDRFFSEDELASLAHGVVEASTGEIESAVADCFGWSGFIYEPQSDADVYEVRIKHVSVEESDVVGVAGDIVQFSATASIGYQAFVSGPDYDTAIYDREDGRYYFMEDFDMELNNQVSVDFTFQVCLDRDDVSASEISDVELETSEFVVRDEDEEEWPYK